MAQQTAVEWLINEHFGGFENCTPDFRNHIEQAKAMEKEQIIRFAISCHQDILRERKAPENLISENLLLFEQYYNKRYKK